MCPFGGPASLKLIRRYFSRPLNLVKDRAYQTCKKYGGVGVANVSLTSRAITEEEISASQSTFYLSGQPIPEENAAEGLYFIFDPALTFCEVNHNAGNQQTMALEDLMHSSKIIRLLPR